MVLFSRFMKSSVVVYIILLTSSVHFFSAVAYIQEGEFPDLVRLRVSMLVEGGCDKFALNLCDWCIQIPEYASDVFIRKTQLLLLHKLDKLSEFYNQCTQLSCCTAVQLLHGIFCVAKIELHAPIEPLNLTTDQVFCL